MKFGLHGGAYVAIGARRSSSVCSPMANLTLSNSNAFRSGLVTRAAFVPLSPASALTGSVATVDGGVSHAR